MSNYPWRFTCDVEDCKERCWGSKDKSHILLLSVLAVPYLFWSLEFGVWSLILLLLLLLLLLSLLLSLLLYRFSLEYSVFFVLFSIQVQFFIPFPLSSVSLVLSRSLISSLRFISLPCQLLTRRICTVPFANIQDALLSLSSNLTLFSLLAWSNSTLLN